MTWGRNKYIRIRETKRGRVEMEAAVLWAETHAVANRPRYHVTARKEYTRVTMPPPPLMRRFAMDVEGNEGVVRLNRVKHYIAMIPLKMSELGNRPLAPKQQEIADAFVNTCLPTIVSPREWMVNRPLFLKMRGIEDSTNFGGVLCARQNGKSWTVAVCLASIMLACEEVDIACYATKQAQAAVIQNYVIQIFTALGHRMHQRQADNVCWFEHTSSKMATLKSFGLNAYVNWVGSITYNCLYFPVADDACRSVSVVFSEGWSSSLCGEYAMYEEAVWDGGWVGVDLVQRVPYSGVCSGVWDSASGH